MKARWSAALVLGLLGAPGLLSAQAVAGSLEGRAISAQHEPLDGAAVTVGGPALQGSRAVTTDASGRFVFLWLPPGTYTLDVRRLGHAAVRLAQATVRLGSRTNVGDVTLASQAVEVAPVEVSAARSAIDPLTAATATPLDSSFFRALAARRDFAPLQELAPLAAPSPFDSVNGRYLGATIGGASELENAYYIDGVDLSGIGEYAIAEKQLPFNFVRDIQVLTGGYEAEFGRALGGVINVVTNSGGNDFHGQLLGFYAGNALRATPRWGYNQTQIRSFAAWDVGVSLSGPIARDRLWYSVAYNPSFAAGAVGFSGLASQVDRTTRHLFAGKLTWRVDDRTDVVLTVLGDPTVHRMVSPAMWGMPEQVADADAVLSRETSGGFTESVRLRRQQGRLLLEASLARTDNSLSHFPLAPYQSFAALATVYDYITNTTSGNSGIDSWARLQRTAAQAALTFATERHTLKAGADYEDSRALYVPRWSQIRRTEDPVYPYSWLTIDERLEGWNRVATLYVQDSWAATSRVRLNAGVRWDGQWLGGINGFSAVIANQVAPRLGVVVEPEAEGRSKLSASWGRFYQQVPAFSAAYWGGTGYYQLKGYRWDPLSRYTAGTVLAVFQPSGPHDAHLRGQYHDEVTLGYERLLGSGLKLGVRALARSLRWVLDDGSTGADGSFAIGNPGRGLLAGLPRATREYRALELTLERSGAGPLVFLASYVLSRNRGNYAGLFEEDMPTAGGGGNATVGYDSPERNAVSDGLLPNDRTHLFKLAGSYRLGAAATVGASFLAASGTPRSEMGQSVWGAPYVVFVQPRGSLGRTPWIWDLNLRGTWVVPARGGFRPQLVLDLFHVGSPRRAIWYDDLHYNGSQDATGHWASTNPNYGRVLAYQQPLSARLGMQLDF